MEFDLDHLKRRLTSMSDEALLEMDPEELVDMARECYDAELAGRGLSRAAAQAPEAAAGASLENPVVVATFTSPHDAKFAQALLESAEIPCSFEDNPAQMWTTGEMRLMVPAALEEQALEVLDSEVSEEELAALAEAQSGLEPPPEDRDE